MARYHHLDSRYGRLPAAAIQLAIESVRDATEVLFATAELSASDLLRVARSVLEAERLYALDPALFAEPEQPARSDWTLACMAERFATAVDQLRERGAPQAAERAALQGAVLLRRVVDSSTRSPLVDYALVLRGLLAVVPGQPRERLELQRRVLAEDLHMQRGAHALDVMLDIGISHLQLGQHARGATIITEVLRHAPTAAEPHIQLAHALAQDFPELALAAAQRALLLAPRTTSEAQRESLRAVIERTRAERSHSAPAAWAPVLRLLRDKPGKRVKSALPGLCESLVPEIAYVHAKHPEPLPDPNALALLRRELQSLPCPMPETVQAPLSASARRS